MRAPSEVQLEHHGLAIWRGTVSSMAEPHRHNEIELNYVSRGAITYLFGGRTVRLEPGVLMLFWGALSHRLTESAPDTTLNWVTLPLSTFLGFALPEVITHPVLHGTPILEPGSPGDEQQFSRWLEDASTPDRQRRRILELELEARLRRLALQFQDRSANPTVQSPEHGASRAAQLAEFIAAHYLEPIQIPDIARAVRLNANYASALFRTAFSMTLLEYLTQHRLAHAQRLLATTDAGVLEIAFASGFGSSSRFYAAFERACGVSPMAYRRRLRADA